MSRDLQKEEFGTTASSLLSEQTTGVQSVPVLDEAQRYFSHARYCGRSVEWGHWGITFMERQPDRTKNYGVIIGFVDFPIGTRGPMDGLKRDYYREICRAWIEQRVEPLGLRRVVETRAGCVSESA
jgi:hypothetical protein